MLKHTRIDKWMNIARTPRGGLPFGAPRLPSHPEQAPLQASHPAMAAPGQQARDQVPLAPAQPASHSVAAPMTPRDMTLWFIDVLQDPNVQLLLQNSMSGFGEAIEENRERITSLEDEMANLRLELEQQKQYSRRNAIRIFHSGWKETDPNENTDLMVLKLINEDLSIDSITLSDISRSHRVGDKSRSKGPRPVLAKFTTYRAKEKVMKAKKDFPEGVYVNEDLSPYIAKLAFEARTLKRERKIADTWIYDGRVYVRPTARDKAAVVASFDQLLETLAPTGDPVTFANATEGRGSTLSTNGASSMNTRHIPDHRGSRARPAGPSDNPPPTPNPVRKDLPLGSPRYSGTTSAQNSHSRRQSVFGTTLSSTSLLGGAYAIDTIQLHGGSTKELTMSSKAALRPNGNDNLSPDEPLDAAISDADSSEDGSDSNQQEKLPNQLHSMSKPESQDEPASQVCPSPTPPNSPSTVDRMSNTVTLTPGRLEFTPRPAKQSERDTTQLQGPDMEIDNHHSKTNDEADAQKTD